MTRVPPRHAVRWAARCSFAAALAASAGSPSDALAAPGASLELASSSEAPEGSPQVHLDRLDFPDVPGAAGYKRHLERFLRKEARRMRWGAGRDNRIEYRFEVVELSVRREGNVLRVTCSAVGRLPGKQSARSQLTFGGDPAQAQRVVNEVLEIVGRGVLTRLASLERRRRGLP